MMYCLHLLKLTSEKEKRKTLIWAGLYVLGLVSSWSKLHITDRNFDDFDRNFAKTDLFSRNYQQTQEFIFKFWFIKFVRNLPVFYRILRNSKFRRWSKRKGMSKS